MVDKLPEGPKPPGRKRRSVFSDLSGATPPEATPVTEAAPASAPAHRATGRKKGWDRTGQVSVVLGKERHERLKDVWASNARDYDAVADLIREAIDEKLNMLEQERTWR